MMGAGVGVGARGLSKGVGWLEREKKKIQELRDWERS